MTEPEVHVRSVRRRRSEPPIPPTPPPPNIRNWLVYASVAALIAALMLDGFLRHRPQNLPLPSLSYATEVRSTISELADSLQIVVSWDLTLSEPAGKPDSIQVKVAPTQQRAFMAMQPSTQLSDTVYLPAPPQGQSLSGISCAVTEHVGQPAQESCTPWQYVRPSAAPADSITQIVVKPSGLQVDPDVRGRCAEWQRAHPERSVWIQVNVTAVPECTGPNRRPTVAQFCAFALLPGGKRVKAANSANNSYCEGLFVEWSRELYS